ncbi:MULTISPECIES: hypothetical protein [unclassified Rathayibacter]|uniref:hypothetical protein n=1 Tax=unclassified Rathayibacter TaxID=2609250 RepID=UPI0011B0200D|nr:MULTISPECIES: hypothetical protein [unclassified Rathayibacter]
MIKRFLIKSVLGAAATLLISGGLSPLASASEEPGTSIKMARRINGEIAILTNEQISEAVAHLPREEKQRYSTAEIQPQLINFAQWIDCFSLNNEESVFAEYVHYWDGVGQDVRLKCGNNTFGYKHIRSGTNGNDGKESVWQNDLNYARQAGWNSQDQGIESWDDLMAAAVGSTVTWPEYRAVNPISQKTCGIAEFIFVDTRTGKIVWSFKNFAVWSNSNDRLLTSYPQGRTDCYPR